jgi:hypothetical protein
MQLTKEGGKWELYIPSELSYGNYNAGSSIPGGMHLILHCEGHKNDVRPQFKKPLSQRFSPNVMLLIFLPENASEGM